MSDQHKGPGSWLRRVQRFVRLPLIIGGIVMAVGMAFLLGLFVMLLWNWLMPEIFGLPVISYWQSWGLVLLAHMLFKSRPHPNGRRPRHDWEWRDRLREKFRREAEGEAGAEGETGGES